MSTLTVCCIVYAVLSMPGNMMKIKRVDAWVTKQVDKWARG